MEEEPQMIVIDYGSSTPTGRSNLISAGTVYAGKAGDDAPTVKIPNVVGRERYPMYMVDLPKKKTYVGFSAMKRRGIMHLNYPIERGVVTNWDDMEKICHYVLYEELCVKPEEHPVMLSEHVLNPRSNREKLLELHFETFGVPAAYIALTEVLQLYATGRADGNIVSLGDGLMTNVHIYSGYNLGHSGRIPIGGRDCTWYMMRMLYERGVNLTGAATVRESSSAEFEIAREIKEKAGYVALDFWAEMDTARENPSLEEPYELPDGRKIVLGSERFRCMEPLFDPSIIGVEAMGIHEMLLKNAMEIDIDYRQDCWMNVQISGGCANVKGIADRLEREMKPHLYGRYPPRVTSMLPSREAVWIGGSLAGVLVLPHQMISKAEYMEYGSSIGAKCPS